LEAFVPKVGDRLRAMRAQLSGRPSAEYGALARRVEELERSMQALTGAASRPAPAPQAPASPPSRVRPSWLDLVGVLTLLGLVVYGTVAFSYVTFFSAFDVSLEEVGLSYATLLRRSGLYLAVVVASLIIAAPFLSFFGDRRADHRRGAYLVAALLLALMGVTGAVWLVAGFGAAEETGIYFQACWTMAGILGMRAALGPMSPSPGWPRAARRAWKAARHPPTREARRARTVGLLVIAAALLFAVPYFGWLLSILDRPVSPWPVILIVVIGTLAIVWGPAGLHRARRVLLPMPAPAAAPLVGVLVIAIVFGGVQHGARAAATVKRLGDLREQGDLARLVLDVSTPRVCAAWVGAALHRPR